MLVAVRNPNSLGHLKKTLEKTDTRKVDIAVLAVRNVSQAGSGEHSLEADQLLTSSETELFSKVVYMAEKAGKHVELIVVPGIDPNLAGVQAAQRLQSSRIVAGVSTKMSPAEQGRRVGEAWEKLPQPRPALSPRADMHILSVVNWTKHSSILPNQSGWIRIRTLLITIEDCFLPAEASFRMR